MKYAAILFLSLAALGSAQDKEQKQAPETVKRLDSVTWDLNTHKLVWVVQTGTKVDGEFVPGTSKRYEVSPDEAAMMFEDQKRGFTEEEAASLHHLLDVLSLYCAESTVWWDEGQGLPLEQKTTSSPKTDSKPVPEGKAVRVDQPQKPKPPKKPFHVSDTDMIASNRGQ